MFKIFLVLIITILAQSSFAFSLFEKDPIQKAVDSIISPGMQKQFIQAGINSEAYRLNVKVIDYTNVKYTLKKDSLAVTDRYLNESDLTVVGDIKIVSMDGSQKICSVTMLDKAVPVIFMNDMAIIRMEKRPLKVSCY